MLEVTDDSRRLALGRLGEAWIKSLPGIPMGKDELKSIIKKRQEEDEIETLKILVTLESESAEILTRLSLTRDIVQHYCSMIITAHSAALRGPRITAA